MSTPRQTDPGQAQRGARSDGGPNRPGDGGMEPEHRSSNTGGRCPICRKVVRGSEWQADHCHETGRSRELLCRLCNLGLGHFKDNPYALRRAAAYVDAHAQGHESVAAMYARCHPRSEKSLRELIDENRASLKSA
jgi:recombination endonuclease VII